MVGSTGGEANVSSKEEDIGLDLFHLAMTGEWNRVVEMYKTYPEAHEAMVTTSGDTALHIAVADGQDKIVQQLVEQIREVGSLQATLTKGNHRGDTPLHLAATVGNAAMCDSILRKGPKSGDHTDKLKFAKSLISARNRERETPLFLAALHDQKKAFFRLQSYLELYNKETQGQESEDYSICRRSDGRTILHCTIAAENFDFAYQIFQRYKDLVNFNDEDGYSPLHLLASKPSAFRSGIHLGLVQYVIYNCIFVYGLEEQHSRDNIEVTESAVGWKLDTASYPRNYYICCQFLQLFKNIFTFHECFSGRMLPNERQTRPLHLPRWGASHNKELDEENPRQTTEKGKYGRRIPGFVPPNCATFFCAARLLCKAMLVFFGFGARDIMKLKDIKKKHKWSSHLMNALLDHAHIYEYRNTGESPEVSTLPKDEAELLDFLQQLEGGGGGGGVDKNTDTNQKGNKLKETPLLVAAKNGVREMVEKILDKCPVAIHDINSQKKNIVLLAVENRQPDVYNFLHQNDKWRRTIFSQVDEDENSALHLAATLGDKVPWSIPGAALQMQWELKWFKFVKYSMPLHFFLHYNKKGQTPKEVFIESHRGLVKDGGKWLFDTSQSCSVLAALIVTVAFATVNAIPGGFKEEGGPPAFKDSPAFDVYAISSLVALCFSITSLVMFLAILTSRHQEEDFARDLPNKLLIGLTSLFVSITAMMVSFCANHFFVLNSNLKFAALPLYAATCFPVTIFAFAQFPLYIDIIRAAVADVPQRSYDVIHL